LKEQELIEKKLKEMVFTTTEQAIKELSSGVEYNPKT
jgi:hypothetical protein